MKSAELLTHATCGLCGNKIGASGLPLFWKVTVERFGIDMAAVRRQDGLAAFLGSEQLASVMGVENAIAQPLMDPVIATVCETCGVGRETPVAVLAEAGRK